MTSTSPAASRTHLITGSTDGLGRVVAERLAAPGTHVLVHGRDRARGEAVVRAVEAAGGTARFYQADFASLHAVRAFAQAIFRDHRRIDLLINNVGIGFGPPRQARQLSADGHELRFAVNYLAPVLLTHLVCPLLEAAAPARIVNVASIGQRDIDFDDPMLATHYTGERAYRQSKLAMIMWTIDLADALKPRGVTVNSLHPATFMETHMVREAGARPMSAVEEGVQAVIQLATSKTLEGRTGTYFDGLEVSRPLPQAFDAKARRRLADLTDRLIGAPVYEPPAR
jgi:NAD(P)-dependent dehydrogenase (short-subunit alcohol dehydrogenase family)